MYEIAVSSEVPGVNSSIQTRLKLSFLSPIMSDNNELSLLGEDLGDDDYDLGNEDEDALLADDYDLQGEDYLPDGHNAMENQTEFVEYEEPLEDDVLDLGVTDALDDLDSEIQESADDTLLAKKQTPVLEQSNKIKKEEAFEFNTDLKPVSSLQGNEGETSVDSNVQLESEEEEEGGEGEGRGRFKSERTNIVSLKSGKTYGNIPDSLDHVIPADDNNSQKQLHKREGNQWRNRRGRGNGPRGGPRQHYHSKSQAALPFQGPVFSPGAGPGSLTGHSNAPGSPFTRHPHPQSHPQSHPHPHAHSHPHPHPHAPPPPHSHPHPQSLRHPPPMHRPHSQPPPPPPSRTHPPPPPPSQQGPPPPAAHPSHLPLAQAQQSLQPLQQSMQQPPHKILINPHFRGAVQPHPEARLIWDSEPPAPPTGDGLLPFPPRVFVDSPYPPSSQGNYEQHSFQHHEPIAFHNSIQHQQLSHAPPPNQNFYPGELYVDHPPPQPPLSQPIHNQQTHQNASTNIEYWHDMQSPHAPNQMQGPPPHSRENFYPPPDAFNNPQFSGSCHVPQDQPFALHLDQVAGAPEPAVWQDACSETMQIPASQVTGQQFPSTQGIFRLANPGVGHGPGPGPGPGPGSGSRFRTPGRNFRNFTQQRPRFASPINGPHQRRHGGQVQHDLSQASQQSSSDLQVSQTQSSQCQNFRSPQKRPSFEGGNTNVVPLTQGRFDSAPKRKKRMPDMSNLHEVQTVDTLPSQIKAEGQDENEDEETREYRKKIEEQKRLRERILQQKEARRKLAALEKQRELQKKDIDLQAGGDATSFFGAPTDPPQGNAIATIVNRNTVEPHAVPVRPSAQLSNRSGNQEGVVSGGGGKQHAVRGVGRGRVRGGRGQVNSGLQSCRQSPSAQQLLQQRQSPLSQHIALQQQQQIQHVQVVPSQGGPPGQRIVRSTLKPAALQKSGQVGLSPVTPKRVVLNQGSQRVVQVTAPRTVTLRGTNNTKIPANQMTQPKPQVQQPQPPQHPQQAQQQPPRRVVQAQQTRPLNSVPGRTVISNQNTSITVTAQTPDVASMPRTKLVAVENLAASTTDSQLRRMCQRVGIVENIQMIPAQRRAVITFSNPASAVTFFKRYQRKMVDLSLISVKLLTA